MTSIGRNDLGAAPVLVLPDEWVIDPLTIALLERTLSAAEPGCAGVVALADTLPPGSSYRVAAERRTLVDGSARPMGAGTMVAGAALVRPGTATAVLDGGVHVDGPLIIEPRAIAFDPWQPFGPLEDASPSGRPPFPQRPVVLLLGLEPDPDLADWARATINAFVRGDTEGRLAVPEPTGGLHLTRPCRPSAASVAALRPDVVIALDGRAGSVAHEWLGADRSAVVVQLTEDTADRVDLVSWRIGHASGRLRARFGRGATPATLADLVRRLCAGPQPLPPVDGDSRFTIRRRPGRRTAASTPAILALGGGSPGAARARFAGWCGPDTDGESFTVEQLSGDGLRAAAAVELVLLHDASTHPSAVELVARRRAGGLPTVVDLGPSDLVVRNDGPPGLTGLAAALVDAAGLVTAPSGRVCAAARQVGARSLRVPTFLAPARIAALETLAAEITSPPVRLGWCTGGGLAEPSPAERAVASLLPSWLDRHPTLELDVVGGVVHVVDQLRAHPRIHVEAGTPDTRVVRHWAAQLWTVPTRRTEADGDLRHVIEAHLLGVPTVLAADHLAVADGLVPPGLAVTAPSDPSAWMVVDELLTHPAVRARHAAQVQRLARCLYGPVATVAAQNRLRGWVCVGGDR